MFQRDKMLAALRWIATNPDKHLEAEMAMTSNFVATTTMAEDAECFCALGRYARECGIDTNDISVEELGLTDRDHSLMRATWQTNDGVIRRIRGRSTDWESGNAEASRTAAIEIGKLFDITEDEIFNPEG